MAYLSPISPWSRANAPRLGLRRETGPVHGTCAVREKTRDGPNARSSQPYSSSNNSQARSHSAQKRTGVSTSNCPSSARHPLVRVEIGRGLRPRVPERHESFVVGALSRGEGAYGSLDPFIDQVIAHQKESPRCCRLRPRWEQPALTLAKASGGRRAASGADRVRAAPSRPGADMLARCVQC